MNIRIKWLDEQFEERKWYTLKELMERKGGKTTQNKQSSSNAKALRKEKIKKKDNMIHT